MGEESGEDDFFYNEFFDRDDEFYEDEELVVPAEW